MIFLLELNKMLLCFLNPSFSSDFDPPDLSRERKHSSWEHPNSEEKESVLHQRHLRLQTKAYRNTFSSGIPYAGISRMRGKYFEDGMTALAEDSEEASLVGREVAPAVSYTEEVGAAGRARAKESGAAAEADYVSTEIPVVVQFHEDAITQAGTGLFQWLLLAVVGLGLAADNAELIVVAFVLPSAEEDLCLENIDKACLAGVTFAGMVVGAIVWGCLADRIGRKTAVVTALMFNCLFGMIAAFMPNYGLFLTTRLFSGIGAGGLMPVLFVYYSEFHARKNRGRRLGFLLSFWALGGLMVALTAWAAIPRTGFSLMQEKKQYFTSWRVFVLLCSLPSLAALIGFVFLPESPRFLLEVGRDIEAMFVYQSVYKTNHLYDPAAQYQLSELELPSRRQLYGGFPPPPSRSVLLDFLAGFEAFWQSVFQLFVPPQLRTTLVLLIFWACAAFGYYGVSLWIPEYLEAIADRDYSLLTKKLTNTTFNTALNASWENKHFTNCTFREVHFTSIRFNHITFENSTFDKCTFSDIQSSRTYFIGSTFLVTTFLDTDLFDYRFVNCGFVNSTFESTKAGCRLDLDFNFSLPDLLSEVAIGQAAIIPGVFLMAFLVDWLGRKRIIGISMFLTSVTAICIWLLASKAEVIAFEAVFNFLFVAGWGAGDVLTTEVYPTYIRATAFGVLSGFSKLAAVVGIVVYRSLVDFSRIVVILTTAAVTLFAGIASVKLPETKDYYL